jgi:hypothetical protein
MKQIKPWIVIGLVFVAGIVVGVIATRLAVRKVLERVATNPDVLRERMERNLARELKLTAEQRPKIHEIVVRSRDEIQELRAEFQPRVSGILKRSEREIRDVLNDAQRQKFDLMLKRKPILPRPLAKPVSPKL